MFPKGVHTALTTPFYNDQDKTINLDDLTKAVKNQIDNGVSGLVLLGTTSESPSMNTLEKYNLVKHIWNKYNEAIFITVGVGGTNTKETLDFLNMIKGYCHGYMVTVPAYNKPTQEGIYQHFKTMAENTDSPIMMYNIPSRTGTKMSLETMLRITNDYNNVCAVKDAVGDINHLMDTFAQKPDHLQVFAGDDTMVYPTCTFGGAGVVSVASNIFPKELVYITSHALTSYYSDAESVNQLLNYYNNDDNGVANVYLTNKMAYTLHLEMRSFIKTLFCESNPIPLKYLQHNKSKQYSTYVMRLPMTELSEGNRERVENDYDDMKRVFDEFNFDT